METPNDGLISRFRCARAQTEALCEPLAIEDHVVQTMPDVSPPKWHLGHTSWFFEAMILQRHGQLAFDPRFGFVFNSYYEGVGDRVERHDRGLLSRPTVQTVHAYRRHVTEDIVALLQDDVPPAVSNLVELGIHHEQQHQELLVTDIKHILGTNPLRPPYQERAAPAGEPAALSWLGHSGGIVEIGYDGPGFSFDNERPRHRVLAHDFEIANRTVTNGEYLAFIQDGGYRDYRHWLSDAWSVVSERGWTAPLYWEERDGVWHRYTPRGLEPIDPDLPVMHVSYYEADAYARWAGCWLPSEVEWEIAASSVEPGYLHTLDDGHLDAGPDTGDAFLGGVWEWTRSPYQPYPGFRPFPGSVGEYNGKFMCNQMVLRGGSCGTPRDHIRPTYRNFWHPDRRFQLTGLRLCR